jgi:hypothetical protein
MICLVGHSFETVWSILWACMCRVKLVFVLLGFVGWYWYYGLPVALSQQATPVHVMMYCRSASLLAVTSVTVLALSVRTDVGQCLSRAIVACSDPSSWFRSMGWAFAVFTLRVLYAPT